MFTDPCDWLPEPAEVGGAKGVLRSALTWVGLLPSDTGEDLVKRVIGIGGDHVVCCDAQERIVLNGVSLDETYLKPGGGTAQVRFDVMVPPGPVLRHGRQPRRLRPTRATTSRSSRARCRTATSSAGSWR